MRKAKKKLAENFLSLLNQTHIEIKTAMEKNENTLAMQLLGQCQEGVIKLGRMIENEEGEGKSIIPMLENYCELTYQIYENLRLNQVTNFNNERLNLCQLLSRIEKSIQNDIKVTMEAVFLPYKASMWDSLESIWQAANDDPDWDVYVISVPYYDKNPDGSFREMHDESNLYPDYVPITKYDVFDFAAHRPDIAFIHNPYDDYGYVTSVHPFFYSKNLKKYVEKLIYIPYFVLDEPNPNHKATVDSMKHFCMVPGVYNSDQTIVQSENMRKIYIDVLTEKIGQHTRPYWEKKILGLGSPKFDKVTNTKKEDIIIPEQWKKILYKSDGSMKKVILYNTSVNALLDKSEQMLKKIQNVIQVFETMQQNVVLLWRPHPLTKATIESMHPELYLEYEKLVEQYKTDGWGIYDDSPDLDRAITICDAYYGDGSSLVQLCQKAGKPVMIQDVEILEY